MLNFNNLTQFYSDNENGYGGYFPLGINNIWHSGIHINNQGYIYPFRSGELVAYNICEEYIKTSWPKFLNADNYNKLSDTNKKLYEKKKYGGYELIDETAAFEKCSNCFILLKHNVELSTNSSSKKDFSFFTLYMNLMPIKDNPTLGDYYNKYKQIKVDLPKEPFYTEWQLKLDNTTNLETIYKYNKGTDIYEHSKFTIVKKTFKYLDYKNIKETPAKDNPKLPANEITFLAPSSTCEENIPFSDVDLKKEIVIIPKKIKFELYRNNHPGSKIADIEFKEERYFELETSPSKSTMVENKDTAVRYLKFKFPNKNIQLTYNVSCYIKISDVETKIYKKSGKFYRYDSDNYENTRPFLNTDGTSVFEAYKNDLFAINNLNEKITINGVEYYKATFEIDKESTDTYEIKATDKITIVIMEGEIVRTTANAGNFTERKDCLICYTDNTKTNPAIVKINETEFIPLDIDDFRNSNSTHSGYVRFDSGRYYYITLLAGQDLQAKLVIKNGFKVNENTKVSDEPTINIIADDLLGYPALCEETNKTYYDLVVFSTEDLSCLGEDEASFYKKGFVKYDEDSNKDDLFVEPKNFWDFFNDKNMIPQIDRNKFFFFGKDRQIDEKELLNFFTSQDESIKECRRNFYKLICRHPLEWDSGFNQKTIKNDYKNVFGKELKGEFYEAWVKNLSDKLAKLSIFEKGFKAATSSKNLFYFMHPLYFLEKVHEDEGLPEALENDKKYLPKEALDLIEVQDKVIALDCLQPKSGRGIYSNAPLGSTFCNHAVFLTIMAVDKKYKNLTNRTEDYGSGFPECDNLWQKLNSNIEQKHESKYFYYQKPSNYWCDILEEASKNEKTGIKEINLKQAQKLANQGYVVIVCYKNTNFRHGNNPISPHFATVRPNANITTYEPGEVQVANVGGFVRVSSIQVAFEGKPIKLYYNTKQLCQKDLTYINQFK